LAKIVAQRNWWINAQRNTPTANTETALKPSSSLAVKILKIHKSQLIYQISSFTSLALASKHGRLGNDCSSCRCVVDESSQVLGNVDFSIGEHTDAGGFVQPPPALQAQQHQRYQNSAGGHCKKILYF